MSFEIGLGMKLGQVELDFDKINPNPCEKWLNQTLPELTTRLNLSANRPDPT